MYNNMYIKFGGTMSTFLFRNRSINDFLDVLASPASVPGGGAVAGLQGAEACALAEMVCNFTLTNKKYASIESDVREVLAKLFSARNEFLSLMDKDAEGFSKLMEVLQKPKESFSSPSERTKVLDDAFKLSAAAPTDMSKLCVSLVPCFIFILEKGNKNLLSDALVACKVLTTCFFSSLENIRVNVNYVKDKAYVEDVESVLKSRVSDMSILEDTLKRYV